MSTDPQREAATKVLFEGLTGLPWEAAEDLGHERERFYRHLDEIIAAWMHAGPASEWRPTSEAPKTPGVWIEVRCTEIFSWRPYKNGHVQDGARGRWRKLNEHGGFDNAELPNSEWRPHRNPPLAKESGAPAAANPRRFGS